MNDDEQYSDAQEGNEVMSEEESVVISDPRGLALPDDVLPETLFIYPSQVVLFFLLRCSLSWWMLNNGKTH